MSNRQNILPRSQEPIAVGDLMRQLFIVREDGSVDHDMLAAHIFADEQNKQKKDKIMNLESINLETNLMADPRIRRMVEDGKFGLILLGMYTTLRILVDEKGETGVSLQYLESKTAHYGKRSLFLKVLTAYDLFFYDDLFMIHSCPLQEASDSQDPNPRAHTTAAHTTAAHTTAAHTTAAQTTAAQTTAAHTTAAQTTAAQTTAAHTTAAQTTAAPDLSLKYNSKNNKENINERGGLTSPEKMGLSPCAPLKKRFVAPTVEEVKAYCLEKGYAINPQHFVDYYETRGWCLSKGCHMKDWRGAVRTWVNRNNSSPAFSAQAAQDAAVRDTLKDDSKAEEIPPYDGYVPDSAPPRPTATAVWSIAKDAWIELYEK